MKTQNSKQEILNSIQEVTEKLTTRAALTRKLRDGRLILLRGKNRNVAIGKGALLKVNTSIGVSDRNGLRAELKKLDLLASVGYRPDTMMDLSMIRLDKPLYTFAIDKFGGPVGTLPHYLCYNDRKGIDASELLAEIERQSEAGISFMTLHTTARKYLYEKAKTTRLIPVVSRGGQITINDMYINNRDESIISLYFDEILRILRRHDVVVSIGTTFRPGATNDALDGVQLEEIELQGDYIKASQHAGVAVMMEGIGHASLDKVAEYVVTVKRNYDVPVMPLGPIPTDAAIGQDHISSAIGATYMALLNGADIINSVTPEEHTGGIPDKCSIMDGLKAARIASHAVNIVRFPRLNLVDRVVSEQRGKNHTCVVDGGLFTDSVSQRISRGCSRCGEKCPLLLSYSLDEQGVLFPK